jgi:tetratricopeptide (TPR) repeat protein
MEDFDALERTLLDVDLFLSLSGIDRFELWRYWHEMPPTRRGFVRAYSHATVSWQRSLGDSPRYELALNELAHIYHACGEREASSSLMEEVLRLARALYPLDDIRVAIRKNNYACTLCHSSRHAEAEPLFQEALPVYIRHFGYLHPDTWGVRESIAVCHFNTGRIIQGLAEEEACLEWFRKHRGDLHFDTLNATYNLACAMERAERPNEAARLFSRAHEGFSRTLGPEHPTTVSCAGAARRIVKTSKQYAEDAVAEPTPGDDLLLRSLQSAASYETKGDHENALTILDELEPICFEWSDAAAMARCLFAKARALRGLGREELAVAEAKTALSFATDAATSLVEPLRLFLESPRSGEGAGRGEILWSERLGTLEDNQSSSDLQNKAEGSSETDFFLRRIQILSAKADVSPLHLRQLALDAYMVGHYTLATSLLQRVIAAGFEMPGAHCHLARIALVTGELAAAQDHAEQAWEHRAEAPPYVTARILWLQLAAEMAASTALANEAKRLGQLKTVLYAEGAHTEWTMTPVLESLRSRVSEDDHALLTALAAALSSADKLFALDEFPAWCAAQPEPLASNSSHEEEAC